MDAVTLRLILIVLGTAFLFWLYRREQRRCARAGDERDFDPSVSEKREPMLGLGAAPAADDEFVPPASSGRRGATRRKSAKPPPRAETRVEPHLEPAPAPPPDDDLPNLRAEPPQPQAPAPECLLVQLYLVAREPEGIDGQAILAAAARHRLIAGERDIFHRYDYSGDTPRVLFSMANLVKPGSFPLRNAGMADFVTPGLAFFAQIEGEPDDLILLDELFDTVTALADELHARIQNEHRKPFSPAEREQLHIRVRTLVETGRLE